MVAGALGALLLATVAVALLPPRTSEHVAIPPSDAAPEQVAAAYLEALNAHDCDTAAALGAVAGEDTLRSWCEDVAALTEIQIGDSFPELPAWSGNAPGTEVVQVPVAFDLDWRLFHNDGSMDEGPTTWGYLLTRSSEAGPWRIAGQGVG